MEQIQMLTEKEISELLRIPLQTLRNQRSTGRGFPYFKIGKSVRYSKVDLVEYLKERRISTERAD